MIAHGWEECVPVMLSMAGADPVSPVGLGLAWSLVPDRDRRLFHEFCCLNQHDDEHADAVERIAALARLVLDLGGSS